MKLVIFGCGRIANRIARSCKMVEGLELVGLPLKTRKKLKNIAKHIIAKNTATMITFLTVMSMLYISRLTTGPIMN